MLLVRKVVGDRNVPSGQLSFAARVGPPQPLPGPLAEAGIVATEWPGQHLPPRPRLVRLEECVAVLPAHGQVNMLPGDWRPEFVPGFIVVWRPAPPGAPARAPCSIIFEDGHGFRTLKDLWPWQPPAVAPA